MIKLKLLALALVVLIACNKEEPKPNNQFVGNYLSLGGAIGLRSGDSLIITNSEIQWLDATVNYFDNNFSFSYNSPWVRTGYSITSDTTLKINDDVLWGGEGVFTYYIRLATDSIFNGPDRCVPLDTNESIYIDSQDCPGYIYGCCQVSWNPI